MNIQTATGYARHGYHIYRSKWVQPEIDGLVKSLHLDETVFMCDDTYYILTVEDCLADDWAILT